MKKNTGNTDRAIRILLAVVFSILNISGIVGSPASIILWVAVAILALTAIAGSCPLYSLFGINTCTRKKTV